MPRKEKAVQFFKQGFNCSQSIFTAYRQEEKIDEQTALKLATVFGAGVACTGQNLCGAVTGALMAISMKYGRGNREDLEGKPKTYDLAKKFMEEYQRRMGSCVCEDILGINIGSPNNLRKAEQLKLFETKCVDAVKSAADILDRML
jgi:C_GCAxxG_C_C family probable redox protein